MTKAFFYRKEGHFIMIKGSAHQEDTKIVNIHIYLTNICTKHTQQEKPKIYEHKIHRIQGIN